MLTLPPSCHNSNDDKEADDGKEEDDVDVTGNSKTQGKQKFVRAKSYAAYFIQDRNPQDNALFIHGKRLFQEWLVDQFSKVESQRLFWICENQQTLLTDLYKGLADVITAGENNTASLGCRVILPPSHIGSPHHMHQMLQDAIAIV